jgi:hypothetical protein
MRVLAIDPGTEKSGFVLFDSNTKSIIESGIVENEELLYRSTWADADFLAVEMCANYGMPSGKTIFETVLWVGRFIQYAASNGIMHEKLYKKIDINPALCFSNKAKDANIRQAVMDMFEPTGGGKTPQIGTKAQPGPLYGVTSHAISALAVALTYCLKNKLIER